MKRRELRSLWNSNGAWTNSGYAIQQRDLLFRLIKDGWPIAQSAFWGHEGYPIYYQPKNSDGTLFKEDWKDLELKVYPKMNDQWGADGMLHHGRDYGANAIFSMQDIWTLDPNILAQLPVWIPWVPIDKTPAPQTVLDKLKYAYKIVCFSHFGQKELEKKGFSSTLILEGTDTEIFKPMDQSQCRRELNLPQDAFVFAMVAANKENPPRKGFQEALEAFKMFHDKHPEAAMIFQCQQPSPAGFPVHGFADYLGVADRMFFVSDYVAVFGGGSNLIAKILNAADVLMHPSQTEGFGLTVIEAASTGTPAIVNNCTSMPEMVIEGKTGVICEPGKPRWTNDNAWVYPADVNSLYEKMEKVYQMIKKNPKKVAKDCREHIVKNYNIETTAKLWIELLEELQDEVLPKPQSLQAQMVSVK